MKDITIGNRRIGINHPTYFIADIAANHDSSLERAKMLIYKCAEAGANAAKFQHFEAKTIVSDYGFKDLKSNLSHRKSWKKSVFDIYQDASLNIEWTPILKETCDKVGIDFFTSPYSIDLVNKVDNYVPAYKIGSGDITWTQIIKHIAKKKKPVFLASGASNLDDVKLAVQEIIKHNDDIVLMQCNTNYTASLDNFNYINLNVLRTFNQLYPNILLGLSDHTPGDITVLGSIALGARVIEKHFTDDNDREGPDHKFSMNPISWKKMVERSRILETSLGNGVKVVEDNEKETVCLQRRSIRLKLNLKLGTEIEENYIEVLRPCPNDAIPPNQIKKVIGKKINRDMSSGEHLSWTDLK